MTLKAEKHHFQNMQVTVHKVSNTEHCLSLFTAYIFALYTSFPFIRKVLIDYDPVISQKTASKRISTWWIPSPRMEEGGGIER